MKRLALLIAAVAALWLPASAGAGELDPARPLIRQPSAVSLGVEVELIANWKAGDRYRIEQINQRDEIRRGERRPRRTSQSLIDVHVAEKGPDGYVLIMTHLETNLTNYAMPEQGGERAAELVSKLFEGLDLEIVTNKAGLPVSLRNQDEVAAAMRKALNQVVTASVPEEKRAAMRRIMGQMLAPKVVGQLILKDPMIFYGLLGGLYVGGPAQTYPTALPFPFGRVSIDATLYTMIREVDEASGTVHIATQTLPDPEQMKQAVTNWLRGILEAQGKEIPSDFKAPPFIMQDTTYYVFDRNRSLPKEVSYERFLRLGNDVIRMDRRSFQLKPAG